MRPYYSQWILLVLVSCIEPFTPPVVGSEEGILVVDGFINAGNGPTAIYLSYTAPLDGKGDEFSSSVGALVLVEGDDQSTFTLIEKEPGRYEADQLQLQAGVRYRVHITTANEREYISEFTESKKTPPIDSVVWKAHKDRGDVSFSVYTHDPINKAKYYMWQYEETWEFHSAYKQGLDFINNQFFLRDLTIQDYTCWQNKLSTRILTFSSERLSQDVVSDYELLRVPLSSSKLSIKYSVLVSQIALSKEAYAYMELTKKNSENLGGLFDPLPSQISGNVTCLSHGDEPVIGFIGVSEIQTKRIFIASTDIPLATGALETYYSTCSLDTVIQLSVLRNPEVFVPVFIDDFGNILGSQRRCTDCTLLGTNTKPNYW